MLINDMDRSLSSSASSVSNCRQSVDLSDKSAIAKLIRRRRTELRRMKGLEKRVADDYLAKRRRFVKQNNSMDSRGDRFEKRNDSIAAATGGDRLKKETDAALSTASDKKVDVVERKEDISYRSISVIGRRREMEDAVKVEIGFVAWNTNKYDFYGVYDGHGGSRVAHACRDRLHSLLATEMERKSQETEEMDWEKMMLESFEKMDNEVNETDAVGSIGSTAVVAVVGEREVVVANCGDSRAVLSRGGATVQLSNDHKPDRPDELARIEDSGGRVINWNGQRVLGVLATSRSIGDQQLKPYVIARPEVMVHKRSSEDEFLILASDGLWDVVSNDLACHVVRKCLQGRICRRTEDACKSSRTLTDASAVLTELALARGSKDNISIIVVNLDRS